MIWRLTLEPRVVEVQHRWSKRYQCGGDIEDEPYYCSCVTLPVALKVSHDSRDAILPMYPLCFASESSKPVIRFNFSLDTLYIDETFDKHLFDFLERLSPSEIVRLEIIAISDKAGYALDKDDKKGRKYWARLGTYIEKLSGLKNILTVHSLPSILRAHYTAEMKIGQSARAELWYRTSVQYSSTKDPGMQLFEDIPPPVAQRLIQWLDMTIKEIPIAGDGSVHRGRGDWVDKRTKPVFGWD